MLSRGAVHRRPGARAEPALNTLGLLFFAVERIIELLEELLY